MISRALEAGVPFAWFTADEAYPSTATGAGAHAARGLYIEECFQQAKNETGLDHYQVRTCRAWYAHVTLSMLALAWLSAARAQAAKGEPGPATRAWDGIIRRNVEEPVAIPAGHAGEPAGVRAPRAR